MKVFMDLDEVLTDFLGGARKALGKEFNDPALGPDHYKWSVISKIPDFWLSLEWMPDAQKLWDRVKHYDTYILSSPPTNQDAPTCAAGKALWCKRELNLNQDRVLIVRRNEKKNFAISGGIPHLLIDDHSKNVEEWRRAGGLAILHSSVPETLNLLTTFL